VSPPAPRGRCSCSEAIGRTTAPAVRRTGCSTTSSIAWVAKDEGSPVAVAAIAALSLSFVAGYVRARGAALGYSVEERHVTRGTRYMLVVVYLLLGWTWPIWTVAIMSGLAALVRAGQVAQEERAA
jgi:hypothetical protein